MYHGITLAHRPNIASENAGRTTTISPHRGADCCAPHFSLSAARARGAQRSIDIPRRRQRGSLFAVRIALIQARALGFDSRALLALTSERGSRIGVHVFLAWFNRDWSGLGLCRVWWVIFRRVVSDIFVFSGNFVYPDLYDNTKDSCTVNL